jgi:hypothetical protein
MSDDADKIEVLLHDAKKWQARSYPELASRAPEELFEAAFVYPSCISRTHLNFSKACSLIRRGSDVRCRTEPAC